MEHVREAAEADRRWGGPWRADESSPLFGAALRRGAYSFRCRDGIEKRGHYHDGLCTILQQSPERLWQSELKVEILIGTASTIASILI